MKICQFRPRRQLAMEQSQTATITWANRAFAEFNRNKNKISYISAYTLY